MVRSQEILLTIGQLAKHAGLGVEAIRYYQRLGLIDIPAKQGTVRYYDQRTLDILRFIRNAKRADFTLREIKALIALDATKDHRTARALAAQKISVINDKLTALNQAKASLEAVVAECEHSAPEVPCAILQKFSDSPP